MKEIIIQVSEERPITPSSLFLVGQLLGKSRFIKKCNTMKVDGKRSQSQIKNGDILLSYIGLLCQGKTAYEDIRKMSEDPGYYERELGITSTIPSAETLRQRMDDIGSSLRRNILDVNVEMFHTYNMEPTPISEEFVPVDLDVTPLDNSKTYKEGVLYNYKGYFGYAPMMAYIGAEGFLVNTELREKSQRCQYNTPAFLSETLNYSHQLTEKQLFVRMDSGNDTAENLGILIEDGSRFIVKNNLRRGESKQEWLDKVKECCKDICHPRDGKTIYVGSLWKAVNYTDVEGNSKTVTTRIVYKVIERTMDKNGQLLIMPDIECNTFWTNLDWNDDDIIKGYHAHSECEQYYSEIKTDMDVERLPSGKFETNELVLELTILAYNILRMIGQSSLKSECAPRSKHPAKRCRIQTVMNKMR